MNENTHVTCDLCHADDGERVVEKSGTFYIRCRRCGFVYTNPRIVDVDDANADYFEESKEEYIRANYGPRNQRAYGRVLRLFSRYRKTGRLLEIGSNVGGFLYRAREMGWDPVGVEPVEGCCEYARKEHGLEAYACFLEDAALPENSIDVVYSNAVFEHLPSPSSVMKAAARLLRPGGVIYTKTVNFDSYTRELLGTEWNLLAPLGHLSLFSPETLPRFCTDAGLEIVKVTSSGVRTPRGMNKSLLGKVQKSVRSTLSRFNLKGDRIIVLARKPE